MKAPQKPRKKLSATQNRKRRWLNTPAGKKWLAQKQQEQVDRELLHQMNAWL